MRTARQLSALVVAARGLFLGLLLALTVPSDARAQKLGTEAPRAGLVLIEERSDAPEQAELLLDPVVDELERMGMAVRQEACDLIHREHSLPAEVMSAATLNKVRLAITTARSAYLDLEFDDAIEHGTLGLELLLSRPSTLARQQELRDLQYDALVTLAMAHNRKGNKELVSFYMGEFLRSFPDRELSRKRYGPEGVDLYRSSRKAFEAGGTASLALTSSSDTMLFVNERYVGVGKIQLDLVPGSYRVYAMKGRAGSRVRIVHLGRDQTLTLDEELRVEPTLYTYRGEATLQSGHTAIEETSRELTAALGVRLLVQLAIDIHDDGLSLIAASYDAEGRLLRKAAIDSTGDQLPSSSELAELARYVVKGSHRGSSLRIYVDGKAPRRLTPVAMTESSSSGPHPAWRWSSWLLGTAGIAAGGVLLHLDGQGTCDLAPGQVECAETYETANTGLGIAIGGGALIATGLVLWLLEDDGESSAKSSTSRLYLLPTQGGMGLGLGGSF